ncbi:UNVERIFIED_CONTAM: hypothetical protein K2H54_054825 [Gekko kuhli]
MRTLPTNTLMGFGAFAALTTYWYATRPKALKPPCDLAMQSVEVEAEASWYTKEGLLGVDGNNEQCRAEKPVPKETCHRASFDLSGVKCYLHLNESLLCNWVSEKHALEKCGFG